MSAPPPQLQAFHIGYVVRDIHIAIERFRVLLGVENWHVRENESPGVPWDPDRPGGKVLMAYGRGAGQTFELIQTIEGRTAQTKFLEQYGEGINHIGYWVPDLRQALRDAVARGAVVTSARVDPDENGVVQIRVGSTSEQIIDAMNVGRPAFVNDGFSNVGIEMIGPGTNLRNWLKEDFEDVVVPPPWPVGS
jgi:catechol 2,3-dioxygenase-like lactoylglutathione lyase family enzyme